MASKFLNLSTDNTLGGNSPSENKAVSEKAIKEYVDNNAGQTYVAGTGLQLSDQNEFNILQEDERDASIIEIGSPLEVENLVYTNFSTSNYLKVSNQIQIGASDTFEIAIKFKQSATKNGGCVFCGGTDDGSNYLKITLSYSSYKYIYRLQSMGTIGRMKNDITSLNAIEQPINTYIWLRVRRASLTMYFDYSTDGSTWVNMGSQQIYTSTIGTSLFNFYLGNGADIVNSPCTVATIDLNDCYIKVNDVTIWNGSGVISKSVAKATDNLYGLVKPDGTSITINDGVISGNVGTVTSVNNVTPVNGNVSLTIPTVDQTYSSSSANAQSGVAINGAKFIRNTATGTDSLTIGGNATTNKWAVNIGVNSIVSQEGVAIGYNAKTTYNECTAIGKNALAGGSGSHTTALGFGAEAINANDCIQIGYGTNSTSKSLSIGFYNSGSTHYNWQLLDGATGLIPDARISSNIARTNAIPTESTVSGWGFTKNTGTVTSVNNTSPDTNGNVTIEIDLSGKADVDLSNVPSSKSILSESYVNGTSWYRVYSDGWCEQGGYVATGNNVTYLKPYLDTNYTLVASGISTSNNSTAYRQIMPNAISETGFTGTRGSGVSLRWYACGYIN